MHQLFIVLFLLLYTNSLSHAELYPFPKEGKWGYINSSGKTVVHPIYEFAGYFIHGVAKVASLNEQDEYLYGFIDETGHEIISPKFSEVSDFSENLASVKLKNKYSYLLKNGTVLTQHSYDKIYPSVNGMSIFQEEKLYGYADINGNPVIPAQFHEAFNFTKDKRAKVLAINGKKLSYGFIDPEGVFRINPIYDDARDFSEGFAGVKTGRDWNFIDLNGVSVFGKSFDDIGDFSEGLALIKIRDLWGYIDKEGEIVIPPIYKVADQFSKGFAIVGNGEFFGFIDKKGNEVTPFIFTKATRFDGKLARVSKCSNNGFMNKSGLYNLTDKVSFIGIFRNDRSRMKVGKYYGYYNRDGKLAIKPEYIYASDFRSELAITISPIVSGYRVAYINKFGTHVKEWTVISKPIPQSKDILYSIAYPSLPFYKENNPSSRVMIKAKYGDVFVKTFQRTALPIVGHGLNGFLYSAEYYDRPGFVFSGTLSKFVPPYIGMGIYTYFRERFGMLSETRYAHLFDGSMNAVFFNGSTLKRTINKNIVEDEYFIPFMEVSESLFLFCAALGYPISEYPSHSTTLPNFLSKSETARFVGRNNGDPSEYTLYIGRSKLFVRKNSYGILLTYTYIKPIVSKSSNNISQTLFASTFSLSADDKIFKESQSNNQSNFHLENNSSSILSDDSIVEQILLPVQ